MSVAMFEPRPEISTATRFLIMAQLTTAPEKFRPKPATSPARFGFPPARRPTSRLLRRNRKACKHVATGILSAANSGGKLPSGWARVLSIPNLITLGRILLVPIVVWAIISNEMRIAFLLFLAAGISDAVDGFLAKRFHMASELGAYLDPLADKALIVSIYVSLGIAGALPIFLVILVVSRDIMIISAVLLAWLVERPMPVKPLRTSKANTVAQILLATLVLAEQAFNFDADLLSKLVMASVAVLTLLSIAFYLAAWVRHMNSFGAGHRAPGS
jgi:cardiolipin synthase